MARCVLPSGWGLVHHAAAGFYSLNNPALTAGATERSCSSLKGELSNHQMMLLTFIFTTVRTSLQEEYTLTLNPPPPSHTQTQLQASSHSFSFWSRPPHRSPCITHRHGSRRSNACFYIQFDLAGSGQSVTPGAVNYQVQAACGRCRFRHTQTGKMHNTSKKICLSTRLAEALWCIPFCRFGVHAVSRKQSHTHSMPRILFICLIQFPLCCL